jgi:hypothetical protein
VRFAYPKKVAVPVALLLLAAALGTAPGANPAAAIAAAAGHPALKRLRAETISAGETSTLDAGGGARLEKTCAADLCRGSWFDGSRRYTFGINGTPFPEREDDERVARTYAAIVSTAFAEPAFSTGGGSVAPATCARAGQICYRVAAAAGAELIAVADARSQRLTEVDLPDETLLTRLRASAGDSVIVYAARAYERVRKTDAAIVAPTLPAVRVGPPRETKTLADSLPIVACELEGKPARCLIDSGTTPSAITLDFAERLGLEPQGEIEISGLAPYLTGVVTAGPLAVGSATFDPLHFAVVPHLRGGGFDVILGSDALAAVRVAFERSREKMQLLTPAANAGEPSFRLDFSGGLPYVDVRLGTQSSSESMLLDTGDTGTLSIGYDQYREDMTLFAVRGSSSAAGLGDASMDALYGILAHAEVGGRSLDSVPISAVRGQHVGHVGYAYTAHCAEFVLELGGERAQCLAAAADFP